MKVLVTGASKGLGKALAKALIKAGHLVWGVARTEALLLELAQELGSAFQYTVADLSGDVGASVLMEALKANGFCPDRVYLNAGVYSTDDTTYGTKAHKAIMLNTNYNGPVAVYNRLIASQYIPKEIVVVSSLFAKLSDELNPFYAIAKAKLAEYFVGQADTTGLNIKVLYLGPIDTKINGHAAKSANALIVSPDAAAMYMIDLPLKTGVEHIYPFTSRVFYAIFSRLPEGVYNAFMKIARR